MGRVILTIKIPQNVVYFLDIHMDQTFIIAIMITVLFCASKFVEAKYLSGDETKPLKEIVRDALVVIVCSMTGSYVYFHFHSSITDFFNVVTETKVLNTVTTQVFTDAPAF